MLMQLVCFIGVVQLYEEARVHVVQFYGIFLRASS
jgi:hypothetical protein